jgi:putative addiction module CopG family antidote
VSKKSYLLAIFANTMYSVVKGIPMPTRNVNLTMELDGFITSRVQSGRYENASEVVRAALRVLEREESERDTGSRTSAKQQERFHPVPVRGEPVSRTILRDRGSS